MNEPTKSQRGKMAAHLTDIAGIFFRGGRYTLGKQIAEEASGVFGDERPEFAYRVALRMAGLAPEDIDAAVAAIMRDEWPTSSLAGRVKRLLSNAENDSSDIDALRAHGRCDAFADVLDMLGVKP